MGRSLAIEESSSLPSIIWLLVRWITQTVIFMREEKRDLKRLPGGRVTWARFEINHFCLRRFLFWSKCSLNRSLTGKYYCKACDDKEESLALPFHSTSCSLEAFTSILKRMKMQALIQLKALSSTLYLHLSKQYVYITVFGIVLDIICWLLTEE